MTNKKFKKAAMALALTACVAATPLAANAEAPEDVALTPAPAAQTALPPMTPSPLRLTKPLRLTRPPRLTRPQG